MRERMEDEARRLEDKLDGGGTTTEVKVEVIKSNTVEGEEDNMEKPRVKQAYFLIDCRFLTFLSSLVLNYSI